MRYVYIMYIENIFFIEISADRKYNKFYVLY